MNFRQGWFRSEPPSPEQGERSRTHRIAGLMLFYLLVTSYALPARAQLPPGTSDASSSAQGVEAADPLRGEAVDALGRGDLPTALKLLTTLAEKYPGDAHVWFDLASSQDALDQISPAEQSYRRADGADPTYFEPRLALGLLLARNHRDAEARTELQTAITLNAPDPMLKARAYRALAHVDQRLNPAESRDALLAALKLSPETPEDILLSAELAEEAQDPAGAEAAYRRILNRTPNDPGAVAGLSRLLGTEGKAGEAEPLLVSALSAHPDDVALTAQLATTYLRENKTDEATALIEKLHAANPESPSITRLYAHLLSQSGQYERSEPLLARLSTQEPADPTLLDDRADALIHLKRYAEAQQLLERALAQPAAFPKPGRLRRGCQPPRFCGDTE